MGNLAELLSTVEVFEKLTDKDRQDFSQLAIRRSLKKGEVLCHQGDDWPFVLYVSNGALRSMINSPDGRSYVVSTWEKGDVFWAHTIFDQTPMPSTLEVVRSTSLYQWEGEKALQVIFRNQNATRALLRRQTQLIRKRRESIYNLAFNQVSSRLAKMVIEKFENAESPTVQRDLTLEDMASMVASSPEVICRILYQFQAEGYLKVTRASITLNNRQALENLILRD